MDKPVVKELIQHEMTAENCIKELKDVLENPQRKQQLQKDYSSLKVCFLKVVMLRPMLLRLFMILLVCELLFNKYNDQLIFYLEIIGDVVTFVIVAI
jgi:hypothetical protein